MSPFKTHFTLNKIFFQNFLGQNKVKILNKAIFVIILPHQIIHTYKTYLLHVFVIFQAFINTFNILCLQFMQDIIKRLKLPLLSVNLKTFRLPFLNKFCIFYNFAQLCASTRGVRTFQLRVLNLYGKNVYHFKL